MDSLADAPAAQTDVFRDAAESPPLRLTLESSACRYLENLESGQAVYFFWGVDGSDSSSRWVAFALPERLSQGDPFVTQVHGVKIVVPEPQRVVDLNGRTLTCEQGRLRVT